MSVPVRGHRGSHDSLTVDAALHQAARTLQMPDAAREARLLLSHVLERDPAWLLAHGDDALTASARQQLMELVRRRARGEPVAYLTGKRGFHAVELLVDSAVLIPRPDTETLVEVALALLPADGTARVADLGTGSGAIAIALAHQRPELWIVAADVSAQALGVARSNVERLADAPVRLLRASWCAALADASFDLVVANPPYVASDDHHLQSGDVAHEPRLALDGGSDGLDAIRSLAGDAGRVLRDGGWLALEHGFDQGAAVRALLSARGFVDVDSVRDLAGHERVTRARAHRPARHPHTRGADDGC